MNWYYIIEGRQAGPADDAQLEELLRIERIQPDTLVWHEGLPNWVSYSEAKTAEARTGIPPSEGVDPPSPAAGEGMCMECGRIFPIENLIRHANSHVCAACKPVFIQRLEEGVMRQDEPMKYASFGLRFSAIFIDRLVLIGLNIAILTVLKAVLYPGTDGASHSVIAMRMALVPFQFLTWGIYETFMIGKFGATLGKMSCKIRVVTADGGRVGYALAVVRFLGKLLSLITCLIGYLVAAFDDEQRALHDRMCNTRVVAK